MDAKLKPLMANLLRLKIGGYLITEEFSHLMLEIDKDQDWQNVRPDIRGANPFEIASTYAAHFQDWISYVYDDNWVEFREIMLPTLKDFLIWKGEQGDFTDLRDSLARTGALNKSAIEKMFGVIQEKLAVLN